MQALSFKTQWISLIMSCVITVNYKVLANWRLGKMITPSRRLRQGDPLSPYMFIMCVEGLNSILNKVEQQGIIQGATVTKGATRINHLLFEGDCILYSRVTKANWEKIQEILTLYEKGSGHKLNNQKSSAFFSQSTPDRDKKQIIQAIGDFICSKYNKYLDLPAFVGRFKYNTFRGLKEKI